MLVPREVLVTVTVGLLLHPPWLVSPGAAGPMACPRLACPHPDHQLLLVGQGLISLF